MLLGSESINYQLIFSHWFSEFQLLVFCASVIQIN